MTHFFISLFLVTLPLVSSAEQGPILRRHYEDVTIPVVEFKGESLTDALAYLRIRVSDAFAQWELTHHVSFEHDFSPTKLFKTVDLEAEDVAFLSALDQTLSQCGLTYRIDGRRIVLLDSKAAPDGDENKKR